MTYNTSAIPLAAVRQFARQAGRLFKQEKIILFGLRAYGRPRAWAKKADSDWAAARKLAR